VLDYREIFSQSFTGEVDATIRRIDDLIGAAHWASVGDYKEGVIRKQLIDYIPARYSVGTGFVISPNGNEPVRSNQIDVLIWDSHNYAPIFVDGEFVVIPPQALRVAIEVKGNLTGEALREGLYNLDSLTKFIPIIQNNHSDDEHAHSGFRRYIVVAETPLKFPGPIFDQVYRYYVRCVFGPEFLTDKYQQLKIDQRIALAKGPLWWGLTPFISGVAILGKGMIRAVRFDDEVGYFVSNDVEKDRVDHTIGQIRQWIDVFLNSALMQRNYRDSSMSGREQNGLVMPVPFTSEIKSKNILANVYPLSQSHQEFTLEDAIRERDKRAERRKRAQADDGSDDDDAAA